jgi:hypothetical protein
MPGPQNSLLASPFTHSPLLSLHAALLLSVLSKAAARRTRHNHLLLINAPPNHTRVAFRLKPSPPKSRSARHHTSTILARTRTALNHVLPFNTPLLLWQKTSLCRDFPRFPLSCSSSISETFSTTSTPSTAETPIPKQCLKAVPVNDKQETVELQEEDLQTRELVSKK